MKPRFLVRLAPKVGVSYLVTFDQAEREDDGQGAVVGWDTVTERWPTKRAAQKRAKKLLADPDVNCVVLSKPIEYVRRNSLG